MCLTRLSSPVRRLRSFLSHEKGISAVEFALILPFLILLYFGTIELSFLMRADRRVTLTASSLGDLTARLPAVNDSDMHELFDAAAVLMQPYPVTETRLRITSVVDSGKGQTRVAWSDGYNMPARATDSTVKLPAGIVPPSGSIILTEVEYDYKSTTGFVLTVDKTVSDTFYMRPRRVSIIERDRASGGGKPAFGPRS